MTSLPDLLAAAHAAADPYESALSAFTSSPDVAELRDLRDAAGAAYAAAARAYYAAGCELRAIEQAIENAHVDGTLHSAFQFDRGVVQVPHHATYLPDPLAVGGALATVPEVSARRDGFIAEVGRRRDELAAEAAAAEAENGDA